MFVFVGLCVSLLANTSVMFIDTADVRDSSTLEVEQKTSTTIFWMMLTSSEVASSLMANISDGDEFICEGNIPNVSVNYIFQVTDNPFYYDIEKGGQMAFFAFNCSGPLVLPNDVSFVLKSPWGYLSGNIMPVLVIVWIEFAWFLVLLIIWIVNMCRHKQIQVLIHHLIFFALITQCVTSALQGCLYLYMNFNKETTALLVLNDVVQLIMNWVGLALVLCFGVGISIVKDQFHPCELAIVVLLPLAFAFVQFLLSSTVMAQYISFGLSIALLVIFCIIYLAFLVVYGVMMEASLRVLKEHMLLIQANGINPKHTPTHRKIKMLKRLRNYGMAIFFLYVFSALLFQTKVFVFWVVRLVVDVFTCVIFTLVCWLCRLRSKMATTYFEDQEAYEVNPSDPPGGQLTDWRPGLKLPPLPKYSRKRDMRVYPDAGDPEVRYTQADQDRLDDEEPTHTDHPQNPEPNDDTSPPILNPREAQAKDELSDIDIDIDSSETSH